MKKSYMSRKDSIVLSAIEIIDELGINDLSIRELAKRQGVSEPALYRHFKSKQDIILAVVDYYSRFDEMLIKTIEERKLSGKESILFLTKSYMEYYENYHAMTAILYAFEALRYDLDISLKIKEVMDKRYEAINKYVRAGQAEGELSAKLQSEDFADIISGYTRHIVLKWRMENYSYSLKERVFKTLSTLLELTGVQGDDVNKQH